MWNLRLCRKERAAMKCSCARDCKKEKQPRLAERPSTILPDTARGLPRKAEGGRRGTVSPLERKP